eukprot:UN00048
MDFLKLYTSYINEYTTIERRLSRIRGASKDAEIIFQQNDAKPISFYLITIIQRPPRYLLLLKDLYKNTPADHWQHTILFRALKRCEYIINHLNEAKQENDRVQSLITWKEKLKGFEENLLDSKRLFLFDDECIRRSTT